MQKWSEEHIPLLGVKGLKPMAPLIRHSEKLNGCLTFPCREILRPNSRQTYALLTSAYNEEATIEGAIKSMLVQSILPERWVIVSDGSCDSTDEIIKEYASRHKFISYLRVSRPPGRSFQSKVIALREGIKLLAHINYDFIGNLDADVTVGPTYFEDLINQFVERPELGLAAGFVYEERQGEFRSRSVNRTYSVAHAAQLVRRECYEEIGGYAILEYGGEDWHAQVSARMLGWEAEAFPMLRILHLRATGEGGNLVRYKFRQGKMDYAFGCFPVFQILKCVQKALDKPFVIGSAARIAGFLWSYFQRKARPVSVEFVNFLRKEQKQKLAKLRVGSLRSATLLEVKPRRS